jgi:hypothetical protein
MISGPYDAVGSLVSSAVPVLARRDQAFDLAGGRVKLGEALGLGDRGGLSQSAVRSQIGRGLPDRREHVIRSDDTPRRDPLSISITCEPHKAR